MALMGSLQMCLTLLAFLATSTFSSAQFFSKRDENGGFAAIRGKRDTANAAAAVSPNQKFHALRGKREVDSAEAEEYADELWESPFQNVPSSSEYEQRTEEDFQSPIFLPRFPLSLPPHHLHEDPQPRDRREQLPAHNTNRENFTPIDYRFHSPHQLNLRNTEFLGFRGKKARVPVAQDDQKRTEERFFGFRGKRRNVLCRLNNKFCERTKRRWFEKQRERMLEQYVPMRDLRAFVGFRGKRSTDIVKDESTPPEDKKAAQSKRKPRRPRILLVRPRRSTFVGLRGKRDTGSTAE
ncbi:unnamed protein product [Cyprideis torosa]|uniref:Uncharacterized protein n=1 Tax=Cyprideis torosa TaxID=163714 RepID=A0A7R8ZLQ4_9CRUS|nr:unnamed protein product [Cyprideis torosa]CAG0887214.1 unnamed protein product [Cyprideis torosa]